MNHPISEKRTPRWSLSGVLGLLIPVLIALLIVGAMVVFPALSSSAHAGILSQAEVPYTVLDMSSQRSPSPACRGCHGDNDRLYTLPSGETVPLLVPLDALDASPHSWHNAEPGDSPMGCTDCHTGVGRYRYPHEENPAQTLAEYRASASTACTECHYPHNPFHEIQDPVEADGPAPLLAAEGLPTCADCHGSHDVATVDLIDETMPAACVDCHTDQEETWAVEYLAPRPGFGHGAEGYVGSERCMGCHADRYLTWRETLHATTIQNTTDNPGAIVADFVSDDAARPIELAQVAFVIGSKWQQRFITQTVEGALMVLPGQWNVATQAWAADHYAAEGEPVLVDWLANCSYCHVTGLDIVPADAVAVSDAATDVMTDTMPMATHATANWSLREFGIGCEDCHGPGEAHVSDPENTKPFSEPDDQVCGACHSRGESPDGHPFPADYKPGDVLTDHFTFIDSEPTRWPDGSARAHNQQYTDWMLGNTMQQSGDVQCSSCHAVHGDAKGPSQLSQPTNQLCTDCHTEKKALATHIPYHKEALTERDFQCNDCHMPLMATSAVDFDIHSHTFLQPDPQGSLDHGGLENMPNACNQCHQSVSETAEWAAETVDWALANYVIRSESVFGPGPTPPSPPPPTPLPSAGEQHEVSAYIDFAWVRPIVYVFVALVGAIVAALVVRLIWLRRKSHAG
jgi:predicted CXXCH cytochrome family protein